jgi:hypothetical protein
VGWGGIGILIVVAIIGRDVVAIPFVIGKLLPVFAILALLHSIAGRQALLTESRSAMDDVR